jgi:hypothetical protein
MEVEKVVIGKSDFDEESAIRSHFRTLKEFESCFNLDDTTAKAFEIYINYRHHTDAIALSGDKGVFSHILMVEEELRKYGIMNDALIAIRNKNYSEIPSLFFLYLNDVAFNYASLDLKG